MMARNKSILANLTRLGTTLEVFLVIWSVLKHYIPNEIRQFVRRHTNQVFRLTSPYTHLYIDEYSPDTLLSSSNMYRCVHAYLCEHGSKNSMRSLRLCTLGGGNRVFRMLDEEEVSDTFEGVTVWWVPTIMKSPLNNNSTRAYKLMFHRKHKEFISGTYLDYVISEGKLIIEKNRSRKLFVNRGASDSDHSRAMWTGVSFQHPANFDNLAMHPEKKREIVEDLFKFSQSKDFYARIGKAWKRGYLLYGPPGTGKSTMIAAMANLLKYDVYSLELTSVSSNEQLIRLLINTNRRSIIAIEDIDCSQELTNKRKIIDNSATCSKDNEKENEIMGKGGNSSTTKKKTGLTLSGLLNFIDGLWSSSEGERIIVFTTNDMHKLDPALIRTGRMDKHIEMSYCCFEGFKVLAKNYLLLETHPKFDRIRSLLEVTKMTPADVGEHLMPKLPDDDDERCLDNLIQALEKAKNAEDAKAKASELKA